MTTEARKITNAIEWLVEALNNNGLPGRGGVPRLDDARSYLNDALKPLFVHLDLGPPPEPSVDAVKVMEAVAKEAESEALDEALACVRYCAALAKKKETPA